MFVTEAFSSCQSSNYIISFFRSVLVFLFPFFQLSINHIQPFYSLSLPPPSSSSLSLSLQLFSLLYILLWSDFFPTLSPTLGYHKPSLLWLLTCLLYQLPSLPITHVSLLFLLRVSLENYPPIPVGGTHGTCNTDPLHYSLVSLPLG